ncbi:MAG: hypothetical protein R3Y38_05690 [Rikenellaceae bacterium]
MDLKTVKYLFFFSVLLLVWGCKEFHRGEPQSEAIARVDDRALYMSQISDIFPEGLSGADSVAFIKKYAENWAQEQIKMIEAEKLMTEQLSQIDAMVEHYRTSLLSFKLEQVWVNEQIDSLTLESDVAKYYAQNKQDFVINSPMVKGMIVKLPETYAKKLTLKKLMNSQKDADRQDFIDLCVKNNFELYEFTSWTALGDFIAVLPTVKSKNYDYLLKKVRTMQEMADAHNKYFIYVSNYLLRGDNAPMENVSEEITRILYNSNKQNIINHKQSELFKQALEDKRIILP